MTKRLRTGYETTGENERSITGLLEKRYLRLYIGSVKLRRIMFTSGHGGRWRFLVRKEELISFFLSQNRMEGDVNTKVFKKETRSTTEVAEAEIEPRTKWGDYRDRTLKVR